MQNDRYHAGSQNFTLDFSGIHPAGIPHTRRPSSAPKREPSPRIQIKNHITKMKNTVQRKALPDAHDDLIYRKC